MWSPRPDLVPRWHALLAWLVMGAPYVEQTIEERGQARLRFHDPDGGVWTVWDATFRAYRHRRVPHGDRRATDRIFVAPDGTKRLARLTTTSDRSLTAGVLALQLRGAEFVARSRFRSNGDAPGRAE